MKDNITGNLFNTKANKHIFLFNNYYIEKHLGLEDNMLIINYYKCDELYNVLGATLGTEYFCIYPILIIEKEKEFVRITIDGSMPDNIILTKARVFNKNITLLDTINKVRKCEVLGVRIKLTIWSDKLKTFTKDDVRCKLYSKNKKVYDGIIESMYSVYEYSNFIYKYEITIGLQNSKTFEDIEVAVFEKILD